MSIPRTLISCFIGLVSCGDMVASDSEIIVAHRSPSAQGRVHFITTRWEIRTGATTRDAPSSAMLRCEESTDAQRPGTRRYTGPLIQHVHKGCARLSKEALSQRGMKTRIPKRIVDTSIVCRQ